MTEVVKKQDVRRVGCSSMKNEASWTGNMSNERQKEIKLIYLDGKKHFNGICRKISL